MVLSFAASVLLFAMVSMIVPLDTTLMNVILCLAEDALFSLGMGAIKKE